MSTITRDVQRKYPAEVRAFAFDFSQFGEVIAGETLSSPSVPAVSGLTIGSPTVLSADFDVGAGGIIRSGKGVKVTVSGGTAGTEYILRCTAATSGGATLEVEGQLDIASPTE